MKCPHCGAWSTVLSTRDTTRRRGCANGHRFTTAEVVTTAPADIARERATAIRDDARSTAELARAYGVSERRILQLRSSP